MSPVGSPGAPRASLAPLYVSPPARALKDGGIMGESTNNQPVRRRVPPAIAEPARAHAPDDAKQPG